MQRHAGVIGNWRHRAILLAALAGAACAPGGGSGEGAAAPAPAPTPTPTPTPSPAPASVEREVDPADTAAGVSNAFGLHIAINPAPAAPARDRLFVMLPGSFATPRTYRLIVRTGPPRGWHAIGLAYPNERAVGELCAGSIDPDCAGRVRREVVTGEDASPLVAVDPANAVIGRLAALLRALDQAYPAEGWGRFLRAGAPDWSRITVAGHSQGGGHAAYLAKLVELDRAVMFSAPGDTGPAGAAQWTGLANATPVERQYGFTHLADPLAPFAAVAANWSAIGLGLLGPPASVDGAAPPYGGSRQLTTRAAPNPAPTGPSAAPEHGAPVVDAVTPLDAQGAPLFRPVWEHLAFP